MADLKNGQTCLEKYSISEREREQGLSDYSEENAYADDKGLFINAYTNSDYYLKYTKGFSNAGHSFWLPSNSDEGYKTTNFCYSNFITTDGGNCVDKNIRNLAIQHSLYSNSNMYTKQRIEDEYIQKIFKIT